MMPSNPAAVTTVFFFCEREGREGGREEGREGDLVIISDQFKLA
jgi:hypothetical protein